MSRKPSGETGFTRITNKNGELVIDQHQIEYSSRKSELECQIMTQFTQSLARVGRKVTFTQNEESDLDFTVTEGSRVSKVDLVEAIPSDGKGSPYLSRDQLSRPYVVAEHVMELIRKKSKHYSKGTIPLDLIVHVTHWRFKPSLTTIALCQHWLQREPTVLQNIWFFEPIDAEHGAVHILAPIPPEVDTLGGKTPGDFEGNVVWTADPTKWTTTK